MNEKLEKLNAEKYKRYSINKHDNPNYSEENEKVTFGVKSLETILSDAESRNQILANLNELFYFLNQRLSEIEGAAGNTILQAYGQEETAYLFEISKEKLKEMKDRAKGLMDHLNDSKFRQYIMVKDHPKYADRLLSHLNQFKQIAAKGRRTLETCSKKKYEIEQSIKKHKEDLKSKSKETEEFKDLSVKKFNSSN